MNVGLIGKGYWGSILLSKLEIVSTVKFICTSKDNYKSKLDSVDWVFIATPNDTHYDIVKNCIKSGKNVFCEKPLTPTHKQSEKLYELATKYNVKLYVDDVFNYRDERDKLLVLINKTDKIHVSWGRESSDVFYDLLYHDLYLLYTVLQGADNIKWPTINNVMFNYKGSDKKHSINNINFTHTDECNDALMEMLLCVLHDTANYEYNKTITLYCNKMIDKINDLCNNTNI